MSSAPDGCCCPRSIVARPSISPGERSARCSPPASSCELLDTLQEFFACGRGLRLTASALGVHENTIRYRFAKIKELSGLDIYGDADDQTTSLLALRVLQLQGLRPWGSTVTASARPAARCRRSRCRTS